MKSDARFYLKHANSSIDGALHSIHIELGLQYQAPEGEIDRCYALAESAPLNRAS